MPESEPVKSTGQTSPPSKPLSKPPSKPVEPGLGNVIPNPNRTPANQQPAEIGRVQAALGKQEPVTLDCCGLGNWLMDQCYHGNSMKPIIVKVSGKEYHVKDNDIAVRGNMIEITLKEKP